MAEWLPHAQQVDHEDQGLAAFDDPAGALLAVSQMGRNRHPAPTADPHTGHALVPTLDHLTGTEAELERLVAIPGGIELLLSRPGHPYVMDRDLLAPAGLFSVANDEVLDEKLLGRISVGNPDFGLGHSASSAIGNPDNLQESPLGTSVAAIQIAAVASRDMSEFSANGGFHRDAISDPVEVVRAFLDRLAEADVDGAVDLMASDVRYENVSMPTIHGGDKVLKAFKSMFKRRGAAFDVIVHNISAEGQTVLTERTDFLIYKRFKMQIWVCGRFDVVDGQITLWRDYFDWFDILKATGRALLGLASPSLAGHTPVGER